MAIKIRLANVSDAGAACDVVRRSITRLCELDHGNDPALIDDWLANKTPDNMASWIVNSHVFVAEDDGRLLGVASIASSGGITLNYVAPEARFRGISKALLSELERTASELGLRACILESTKTATRFYRAAGYVEQAGGPEGVL
jgi:GNAT superfamily N-acetyltransferase